MEHLGLLTNVLSAELPDGELRLEVWRKAVELSADTLQHGNGTSLVEIVRSARARVRDLYSEEMAGVSNNKLFAALGNDCGRLVSMLKVSTNEAQGISKQAVES